jgi:uncharacterized membrane protein YccC
MAWDQRIISIITVYIGFAIALALVPTMWRERKQLTRQLVALWAMCWCFGVGSLLNTDRVYLFIAHISHIPNLGWLLINLLLMAIGYCVFIIASMPSGSPQLGSEYWHMDR